MGGLPEHNRRGDRAGRSGEEDKHRNQGVVAARGDPADPVASLAALIVDQHNDLDLREGRCGPIERNRPLLRRHRHQYRAIWMSCRRPERTAVLRPFPARGARACAVACDRACRQARGCPGCADSTRSSCGHARPRGRSRRRGACLRAPSALSGDHDRIRRSGIRARRLQSRCSLRTLCRIRNGDLPPRTRRLATGARLAALLMSSRRRSACATSTTRHLPVDRPPNIPSPPMIGINGGMLVARNPAVGASAPRHPWSQTIDARSGPCGLARRLPPRDHHVVNDAPTSRSRDPLRRQRAAGRQRRLLYALCSSPAVPARLLLLCLLLSTSWLTVGRHQVGAVGVLHRRGGRAGVAESVGAAPGVLARNSRSLVARLPSSRVDAVVSRRPRDGSSSSGAAQILGAVEASASTLSAACWPRRLRLTPLGCGLAFGRHCDRPKRSVTDDRSDRANVAAGAAPASLSAAIGGGGAGGERYVAPPKRVVVCWSAPFSRLGKDRSVDRGVMAAGRVVAADRCSRLRPIQGRE
jgi:hypothetical protein